MKKRFCFAYPNTVLTEPLLIYRKSRYILPILPTPSIGERPALKKQIMLVATVKVQIKGKKAICVTDTLICYL